MWISRSIYQDQKDKLVRTEERLAAIQSHASAMKTTMDWMMVRLTQLEHERAQLIFNYTGVKIAVPSVEPVARPTESADMFNQLPSFDDVGDEEAARLGLDWDSEGELINVKK